MAVALAFGAAAAAVAGAWELLAAAERTRVAAFFAQALAPLVRAGQGVSPTTGERRRLGVRAAAARAGGGGLVGGVPLGIVAAIVGPVAATLVLRPRRRRFRAALADATPVVARALADAL